MLRCDFSRSIVLLLCSLCRWATYKLNAKTDKLCVFVSLVSTKIPFKGTSKEYIGDDKGVLHECIKKAITSCCQQIRRRMVAQLALREKADRKKQMSKYIPSVAHSFMQLLTQIGDPDGVGSSLLPPAKRRRVVDEAPAAETHNHMIRLLQVQPHELSSCANLLSAAAAGTLNEEVLEEKLHAHVEAKDAEMELLGGEEAAEAGVVAGPFFIGGLEKELEMKNLYADDFKIKVW